MPKIESENTKSSPGQDVKGIGGVRPITGKFFRAPSLTIKYFERIFVVQ